MAESIDCNSEMMYNFVYKNLYPKLSNIKKTYKDSDVYLDFIVGTGGEIKNAEIRENPPFMSGKSVVKSSLNDFFKDISCSEYISESETRVSFAIPKDAFDNPDESKIQLHCGELEIFKVVETMPVMPGCETLGITEQKDCTINKFKEYIYSYINYPEVFKIAGNKGELVLQLVVEKDGSMSQAKAVRDIGFGMGKAVRDAVKKMNEEGIKMIPGKQRNKNVTVLLIFPITFDPAKIKK